jgi:phosphatidate cytidylyltransferase
VKRVLTSAILIPLVILALFKAPLWLVSLLVFGVALLAAHEYLGIVKASGFRPFYLVSYTSLALLFAMFYLIADLFSTLPAGEVTVGVDVGVTGMLMFYGMPAIAMFIPLVLLAASLRRDPLAQALPDAAMSYMLLPYVGFTLALLPVLRAGWNGALFLLYLMLLVWCGDIAAYYVGRAFGKHKLAPRISPGKTWEGSIASVIAAIAVGLVLFHYINGIASALRGAHLLAPSSYKPATSIPNAHRTFTLSPLWLVALFAAGVNIAAQLGDLVESALKRGAGVKDSGALLPGHGGVLDRIDALLFALPVGFIFYVAGLSRYFSSGASGTIALVAR